MKKRTIFFALLLTATAAHGQQRLTLTPAQLPYAIKGNLTHGDTICPMYRWHRDGVYIPLGHYADSCTIPRSAYPDAAWGTVSHTYYCAAMCSEYGYAATWHIGQLVMVSICAGADLPKATLRAAYSGNQVTFAAGGGVSYSWSWDGGTTFGKWTTTATQTRSSGGNTVQAAVRVKGANGCVSAPEPISTSL